MALRPAALNLRFGFATAAVFVPLIAAHLFRCASAILLRADALRVRLPVGADTPAIPVAAFGRPGPRSPS